MAFKPTFEKALNKELELEHQDVTRPVDVEFQQGPPPSQVFSSYCSPQRPGIYVPTLLFVLFTFGFLFESSVLFVYTVVALYNTLPSMAVPVSAQLAACNYPALAPNLYVGAPAAPFSTMPRVADREVTITVTVTVTATPATPAGQDTTALATSATQNTSADVASSDAGIAAIIAALTGTKQPAVQTVTAPVPTITVLSTAWASQAVVTETVLSTAAAVRPTVTLTSVVST